jgi:predicted nucleic acid-binding protein
MNQIVVDASVGLKWVLFEEFTDQARALLADALHARRPLVVPPHFLSEATSALYQRTRTSNSATHISEEEAKEALVRFSQFPLAIAAPNALYEQAFGFAREHRLPSLYDSLYVVLAKLLDGVLWTADQRLMNTAAPVAPWVRFIGDYQQP